MSNETKNRVIKFRAWDPKKKIMIYDNEDDSCRFWDGEEWSVLGMINWLLERNSEDDYIFLQFTGFYDKNGKEIYDGDILKCDETVMRVAWRYDLASFVLKSGEWAYDHFFKEAVEANQCKIIGNKFENPELLK